MQKYTPNPYEKLEQIASYINSCNTVGQISDLEIRRIMGWARISGRRKICLQILTVYCMEIGRSREPHAIALELRNLADYLRSNRTSTDLITLGRHRKTYRFNRIIDLCDKAFK